MVLVKRATQKIENVDASSLVPILPIRYAIQISTRAVPEGKVGRVPVKMYKAYLTWPEPSRFLQPTLDRLDRGTSIWTVTRQSSRPAPIHDGLELLSYPAYNVSALYPDTAQFSNSKILPPPFGATVPMLAPEPSIPCCSCML